MARPTVTTAESPESAAERPLTPCPYTGLVPYDDGDADRFFGRDAEREIVLSNLIASRLTVLYGASGVGKTSLLRAGALHHLNQRAQVRVASGRRPEFLVIPFASWRDEPLHMLSQRARTCAVKLEPALESILNRDLTEGGRVPLANELNRLAQLTGTTPLLILDQFEEYFVYYPESDPGGFEQELARAIGEPSVHANFMISIREDALSRLDRFESGIPRLFANVLRIEHLDMKGARDAIEKPVIEWYNRQAEVKPILLEKKLVDDVLEQVRTGGVIAGEVPRGVGKPAANMRSQDARVETPFLQLVMTRLWNDPRTTASRVLAAKTLQELGGAAHIVDMHMREKLAGLTAEQQQVAASVFRYLVTQSGGKVAHTAADLASFAGLSVGAVDAVVRRLSDADCRVLRSVEPALNEPDTPRYQIFHDVLSRPVLDWRAWHAREEARRASEAKEAELKNQRRRLVQLSRGVISLTLLSLLLIGLGVKVYLQGQRIEKQRDDLAGARAATRAALERVVRESDEAPMVVWAIEQLLSLFGCKVADVVPGIRAEHFRDNRWVVSVVLQLDQMADVDSSSELWARELRAFVWEKALDVRKVGAPPSARDDDSVNHRVPIAGGSFVMGSDRGLDSSGRGLDSEEAPAHTVKVSAFLLQEHEVTNWEYRRFDPAHDPDAPGEFPTVNVSWYDATAYAWWLGGDLPTEAQWEYAARGAAGREFPWGNRPEPSCTRANISSCREKLAPVKLGRVLGRTPELVYDLAGNAWEWVRDWHGPYRDQAMPDPTGPPTGETRVVRGGSFYDGPSRVRGAFRYGLPPSLRRISGGFRLAFSATSPPLWYDSLPTTSRRHWSTRRGHPVSREAVFHAVGKP